MIVVATTDDATSHVAARLAALGCASTRVVAPGAARRLVLATADDEWQAERVVAALRAEGEVVVARPDGGVALEAWTRHTAPVTFGPRLSVCFAWSEHDRTDLANVVELGTGGFGSGQHPTTRLLTAELLDRITGGERVLDVGCGSGVLGLVALALGAASVVATDIKEGAVEATRRNAALNAMGRRLQATSAPLGNVDGRFDVVVANIGRSAVVELAPQLVERVAPGGWLAVSGFPSTQASTVAAFLRPLVQVGRTDAGEWSAVTLAGEGASAPRSRPTGAR